LTLVLAAVNVTSHQNMSPIFRGWSTRPEKRVHLCSSGLQPLVNGAARRLVAVVMDLPNPEGIVTVWDATAEMFFRSTTICNTVEAVSSIMSPEIECAWSLSCSPLPSSQSESITFSGDGLYWARRKLATSSMFSSNWDQQDRSQPAGDSRTPLSSG